MVGSKLKSFGLNYFLAQLPNLVSSTPGVIRTRVVLISRSKRYHLSCHHALARCKMTCLEFFSVVAFSSRYLAFPGKVLVDFLLQKVKIGNFAAFPFLRQTESRKKRRNKNWPRSIWPNDTFPTAFLKSLTINTFNYYKPDGWWLCIVQSTVL